MLFCELNKVVHYIIVPSFRVQDEQGTLLGQLRECFSKF